MNKKHDFFVLWNTDASDLSTVHVRKFKNQDEANVFLQELTSAHSNYTRGSARVIVGYDLHLAGWY